MPKKAYLVLQDGQVFEGYRFGADNSVADKPTGGPIGELVFTTGMTGYVEALTDPSYYGQIILHTFPLIGNYGMMGADMESGACHAKGYVVREYCDTPSNFRSEGDVDAFLKAQGVPGLYGVDTRAITRAIREAGVLNACIVDDPAQATMDDLAAYAITNAVAAVGGQTEEDIPAKGEARWRIALLDYGAKRSIAKNLTQRGCEVLLLPHNTSAADVLAHNPDGILLSNGPGDPAENTAIIAELQKLLGKAPIFGICLGHQLLALAAGAKTEKLKYGHRGANQPVKDLHTGRIYITSQNHGYEVVAESLPGTGGQLRMVNANDGSCEGVDYPEHRAFSVQFHPEACAGPTDTQGLFDRFVKLMEGGL